MSVEDMLEFPGITLHVYLNHFNMLQSRILFRYFGKPWADPEGGQGSGHPLKNHKNIRFPSNTGPDPLKNHRATKPAFNVGPTSAHQLTAI